MIKISALVLICSLIGLISGESGVCTWYGDGLEGATTASGEKYHGDLLTAAHKTLAFGTHVKASCNGKTVEVRINDRGPFDPARILNLSKAAAEQIGLTLSGICNCTVVTV